MKDPKKVLIIIAIAMAIIVGIVALVLIFK